MPVTFSPAKHPAESYDAEFLRTGIPPLDILKSASRQAYKKVDELLQSTFDTTNSHHIIPQKNGLVNTISDAYNEHRALILRPDDIWIAILTQFNFFVNGEGTAERLRSKFVDHEGQKKLVVTAAGNRYTVDFGNMAKQMTGELRRNVNDPLLCDWILPKFSTTTDNDTVVCSIVMMATLKQYYTYRFGLRCGIPQVTLEGEKSDWEELIARIEKLKEYGEETTAWHRLLLPVLSRFVKAVDDPHGEENLEFWQKVAHVTPGGSGPTWLSGWLTAFCVFDHKGKWLGNPPDAGAPDPAKCLEKIGYSFSRSRPMSMLVLDGVNYHVVDTDDIPPASGVVDVELNDNGEIFASMLAAGLVGSQISSSGSEVNASKTGVDDTVKPVAGWWMFTKRAKGVPRKANEEDRKRREARMALHSTSLPSKIVPP